MDFDRKLRENIASQLPIFLSDDHLKPCMKDELFPFEASSQKGYLQDFHNIDQFNANGTSSNHMFGSQNTCYHDPFDPYPYGSSTNLDFYECKPFADQNGGHGTVMDNFQSGVLDNFQSGGYVNLSQRNPINILGSNHNHALFNCQDIKPVNFVVPDEVSSVTAETGCHTKVGMNKNRAAPSNKKLYKKRKSNVVKGQWTIEEDRLLIQLVDQYGIRKWSHIAQMLPGRIGKQCRERWHNHLRPDIKKDSWSEEEDRVLIQAHAEIGNKWAEIAKKLPGRTENSIKNHWNATKRRQYSKRKCRSKYPKGTLLQEYIKNLKLDTLKMDYRKKTTKEAMSSGNNAINATTQTQNIDFCPSDRLVPNFDFNDEVPDFSFDGKMFEDGCSIDSLFDELPATAPVVDKKSFEMEMPIDVAAMTMEYEVKKELDLVEMISQVNL